MKRNATRTEVIENTTFVSTSASECTASGSDGTTIRSDADTAGVRPKHKAIDRYFMRFPSYYTISARGSL